MVLYPHGPLEPRGERLHVVEGRWKRSPFERKMTIFVLAGGDLAIHSPIAMDDAAMSAIEALGRPAWILVPNRFHGSDAGWYGLRYAGARVLVPRESRLALFEKLPRIDGSLDDDWPEALRSELEVIPLRGTRIGEVAFVHTPSRTLVLTDACFHYRDRDLSPIARLIMRVNGAYGRFGATRIFRHAMVADKRALSESVGALLSRDFDRVIVSHGRMVESGGKEAVGEAFGWL